MAKLRVALVGCGKIGQKHLQALVHTKMMDLVATVDQDVEKAAAAAVAFDAASYSSIQELCHEHPDIEAAIIATPSGTHPQLVEEALSQNLHVLLEKPMALLAQDARHMIDLAKQRGRVFAVTHFYRLLPTVTMALDAFNEGKLGRLVEGSLSVRYSRPEAYYEAESWRGTRSMDGGVLYNQAIHGLDAMLQFSGPIVEVFGYGAALTHDIEVEDTFVAVLRTRQGALLTVNATTSVAEVNLEERLSLIGSEGSVVLGPTVHQVDFWRVAGDDEEAIKSEVGEAPIRSGWKSHAEALADFSEAVQNHRAARLSAESVLHTIEVIEALLTASQTGRPVAINPPSS